MATSILSPTSSVFLQTISIATALLSSGSIATLSIFDIPEIQSQPASRSLPMTRWLFSRGSHIFPTAAFITSAGFFSLAATSLKSSSGRSILEIWRVTQNSHRVNGFLAAAVLTISIAPFTALVMVPAVNFELIEANERQGGTRSSKDAQVNATQAPSRSAEESVSGKGQINEFTDLSGPQSKTRKDSTPEEDHYIRQRLQFFAQLNLVRAVLMGVGGLVGLWTALL